MRVKLISCLALMLLLAFASAASANPVGPAFPAIRPAYGPDSADMGKATVLIGDMAKLTDREIDSHGDAVPTGDMAMPAEPVMSIPGPEAFLAALVPPSTSSTMARSNIYKTLVGKSLTYYSIAGKPMSYTITADSIKSIDGTIYKKAPAWKVRIGTGLAWDLTMDASGTKILATKQLFQT